MLSGIDISRYQRNMKDINEINDFDFVIMKASEGATYRDGALQYFDFCLADNMLKGFYHFGRPDRGNSAKSEASNFIGAIMKYDNKNALLALDLEANALKVACLDLWALEFVKYVKAATGKTPLIYTSQSEVHRFKKCAEFGCGLWVAKWSMIKPTKKSLKPWEFFAIWQNSNIYSLSGVRVDHDYFNGKREQYLKYCEAENG